MMKSVLRAIILYSIYSTFIIFNSYRYILTIILSLSLAILIRTSTLRVHRFVYSIYTVYYNNKCNDGAEVAQVRFYLQLSLAQESKPE